MAIVILRPQRARCARHALRARRAAPAGDARVRRMDVRPRRRASCRSRASAGASSCCCCSVRWARSTRRWASPASCSWRCRSSATSCSPRRSAAAGAVVDRALRDALGADYESQIEPSLASSLRRSVPMGPVLLKPFFAKRRDVDTRARPRVRRRGQAQPARRLPPPIEAPGLPGAHLRARRRMGDREEGQPGAPRRVPLREPGLGLRVTELPPESGRDVPRPARRREARDRVGARATPTSSAATRRCCS